MFKQMKSNIDNLIVSSNYHTMYKTINHDYRYVMMPLLSVGERGGGLGWGGVDRSLPGSRHGAGDGAGV